LTKAASRVLRVTYFTCDVAVLTQEITECPRASLLVSARLHNVNVMYVGTFLWSMKERTDGIVNVRHVKIARRGERLCGSFG
jgi:hypothetical protein